MKYPKNQNYKFIEKNDMDEQRKTTLVTGSPQLITPCSTILLISSSLTPCACNVSCGFTFYYLYASFNSVKKRLYMYEYTIKRNTFIHEFQRHRMYFSFYFSTKTSKRLF